MPLLSRRGGIGKIVLNFGRIEGAISSGSCKFLVAYLPPPIANLIAPPLGDARRTASYPVFRYSRAKTPFFFDFSSKVCPTFFLQLFESRGRLFRKYMR